MWKRVRADERLIESACNRLMCGLCWQKLTLPACRVPARVPAEIGRNQLHHTTHLCQQTVHRYLFYMFQSNRHMHKVHFNPTSPHPHLHLHPTLSLAINICITPYHTTLPPDHTYPPLPQKITDCRSTT